MKRLTRGQAIRNYCKIHCCVGSIPDWKECPVQECYLWNFRLGREIHKLSHTKPKCKQKKALGYHFSAKKTIVEQHIEKQTVLEVGS